jgi:transposase
MQDTIAVDLAKSVFQVAESPRPGRVSRTRRLSRSQFERYLSEQAPSRVLMEACGSAHHWARRSRSLGHTVTLLPPHHVRRYRGATKTDRADAKALLEADRNEEIHPVPVKSEDQQCLAALHRLRSGYKQTRTARINAIRGLLREFGWTIPVGAGRVVPFVHGLEPEAVPASLRAALLAGAEEIQDLERRTAEVERQLEGLARQLPVVAHLRTIPGIGLITATALVASVGDIRRFRSARHFASYLGLTPREHSSGLRRRLGAISKQGDTYLRMLLIHGARVVLR